MGAKLELGEHPEGRTCPHLRSALGTGHTSLHGIWHARWIGWGVVLAMLGGVRPLSAEPADTYSQQIKPLLKQRCFACHGPLKQESGLRLDTVSAMLVGGDSGPVVTPGHSATSLLLARLTTTESDARMPPEQQGERLADVEIERIRNWITRGAAAPADERPEADPRDHWSFQPIVRPAIPRTDSEPNGHPIDAFLSQGRERLDVTPQQEAPRIIQLRRLYLDLLGIPPSAEELAAFESDPSPRFYERTVERLLDDPRHGQRWGRHWMDIWRYSDWWGLGQQLRNSQSHMWHWRDWIVESLNADLPYDEMIRLMLAADELSPDDLSQVRATGFLARNYFLFNRPQWMEETVEHVSKGFLGLTMNCSRCHDHKFDPIEQEDFYRLRAFFEPYHVRLDMVPGEPELERNSIPRVFDGWLDTPTYLYVRGDEKQPDTSRAMAPGLPRVLAHQDLNIQPVSLPAEAWQPERRAWVLEAYEAKSQRRVTTAEAALSVAEGQLSAALEKTPDAIAAAQAGHLVAVADLAWAQAERSSVVARAHAMRVEWQGTDDSTSRVAAIQSERQLDVARARHAVAVAFRNLQAAAPEQKKTVDQAWKTAHSALEAAIATTRAEITAKDSVTRFAGAKWTPTRFLNSGADDPAVAFPPTSTGRRSALAKWITDRGNPLTARVAANHIWMRHMGEPLVATVFDFGRNGAPPTHPELLDWLSVEFMESGWSMKHLHRLIVTSAAYRMSSSTVAAAEQVARDPENRGWWRRVPIRLESEVLRDMLLSLAGTLDELCGGPPIARADQAKSTRRSLYFFHSQNERNLFLTTFDEAPVNDCYRRDQSIVPQQALALSNSALVLDASQQIAQRLGNAFPEERAFVETAFAVVLGIRPNADEVQASVEALAAWRGLPGGDSATARAHFVWALINHNDFVTLR